MVKLIFSLIAVLFVIFATVSSTENDRRAKSKGVVKCQRRTSGRTYCPLGRRASGSECPWRDDVVSTFRSRLACIKSLESCTFKNNARVWRCETDPAGGKARLKCKSNEQEGLVYCPKDYSSLKSCPFGDKPLKIYSSYKWCVKSLQKNCTMVDDGGILRCTVMVANGPNGAKVETEEENEEDVEVDGTGAEPENEEKEEIVEEDGTEVEPEEEEKEEQDDQGEHIEAEASYEAEVTPDRPKCQDQTTSAIYCPRDTAVCVSPTDEVLAMFDSYDSCVESLLGMCTLIDDGLPARCIADDVNNVNNHQPTYALCHRSDKTAGYCTLDPCRLSVNDCCGSRYNLAGTFQSLRDCRRTLGFCVEKVIGGTSRVCYRERF